MYLRGQRQGKGERKGEAQTTTTAPVLLTCFYFGWKDSYSWNWLRIVGRFIVQQSNMKCWGLSWIIMDYHGLSSYIGVLWDYHPIYSSDSHPIYWGHLKYVGGVPTIQPSNIVVILIATICNHYPRYYILQ